MKIKPIIQDRSTLVITPETAYWIAFLTDFVFLDDRLGHFSFELALDKAAEGRQMAKRTRDQPVSFEQLNSKLERY
jgi:hypothetical protein